MIETVLGVIALLIILFVAIKLLTDAITMPAKMTKRYIFDPDPENFREFVDKRVKRCKKNE